MNPHRTPFSPGEADVLKRPEVRASIRRYRERHMPWEWKISKPWHHKDKPHVMNKWAMARRMVTASARPSMRPWASTIHAARFLNGDER